MKATASCIMKYTANVKNLIYFEKQILTARTAIRKLILKASQKRAAMIIIKNLKYFNMKLILTILSNKESSIPEISHEIDCPFNTTSEQSRKDFKTAQTVIYSDYYKGSRITAYYEDEIDNRINDCIYVQQNFNQ